MEDYYAGSKRTSQEYLAYRMPSNTDSILKLLKQTYPDARMILRYSNEWELLVAVILSAQCTDVMVNKVTEKLFKKYKTLDDYIRADIGEFEQDIKSTGFYHNKAKNILASARILKERFKGKLPKTITEMLEFKGVARKTANVVLGNAHGVVEGIAVDTHVTRLSHRLGLTKHRDPKKIEQDLMKIVPQQDWFQLTYWLIEHGRNVCKAQRPQCDRCVLNKICPSAFQFSHFLKRTS